MNPNQSPTKSLELVCLKSAGRAHRTGKPLPYPISFSLNKGEFAVLLGPNGAGKTSLLRILGVLDPPEFGQMEYMGINPWKIGEKARATIRRKIGAVTQHQHFNALIPITVRDMVLFGRLGLCAQNPFTASDRPHGDDLRMVEKSLSKLDINHIADRRVRELSGGELRKVQMALVLAQEANLLLLDEPTSGLDLDWQEKMVYTVENLFLENRKIFTILMSTHHTDHIPPACTRVIMFSKGAILFDGPIAEAMTDERLSKLYQTPVEVSLRSNGRYYCIPKQGRQNSL